MLVDDVVARVTRDLGRGDGGADRQRCSTPAWPAAADARGAPRGPGRARRRVAGPTGRSSRPRSLPARPRSRAGDCSATWPQPRSRRASGALARLFASMSAAVAQHLAVLPARAKEPDDRARRPADHARGRARRRLRLRRARARARRSRARRRCTPRCGTPTRRTGPAATASSARSRRPGRPRCAAATAYDAARPAGHRGRRRPARRWTWSRRAPRPTRRWWPTPSGGAGRGRWSPHECSDPRARLPRNSRDIPRSRRVRGPLRRGTVLSPTGYLRLAARACNSAAPDARGRQPHKPALQELAKRGEPGLRMR